MSWAERLTESQTLATNLSAPLGLENKLSHSLLYFVIALSLLLLLSVWRLLRWRKRAQALEEVMVEANRSRRELLSQNDLLTVDVGRRKALECDLRASEERYRFYIEHAPIGMFVMHGKDEFALVNSALSSMTGFSKTELCTMKLAALISSDKSKESTPFLLARVCELTGGDSLAANIQLVLNNARLAAAVALAFGAGGFLAALAGLGNCPFHPADFTILNRRISAPRLGHAFSVHGLTGNLGWAAAAVWLAGKAGGLQARMHWLDRVAGTLFIVFGLKLAFTDNPAS